jgi:hypothetical protein
MYIREDQADIRLTVYDNQGNAVAVGDGNSWTDYQGAELTAKGAKTRPGGMGKEIELGGPGSRSDCTLQIQNSPTMVGLHGFLESRIGKGRAAITITYLDDEGAAIPGAQFLVHGRLNSAALPAQKFDSPNPGFYKVIVGANE